jgi:hypothetical protein
LIKSFQVEVLRDSSAHGTHLHSYDTPYAAMVHFVKRFDTAVDVLQSADFTRRLLLFQSHYLTFQTSTEFDIATLNLFILLLANPPS